MDHYSELLAIAERSRCSKLAHKHYMPIYARYFAERRNKIRAVLELGFGDGTSLRMWEEWFPKATALGVDSVEIGQSIGRRSAVLLADQADPRILDFIACHSPLDLIIDDAGHDPRKQWASLQLLWPQVGAGGCYVIEDLESSYWKWDDPVPMTEKLKNLVDGLNEPYVEASHRGRLTRLEGLAGIHLYPNIAFLWRK